MQAGKYPLRRRGRRRSYHRCHHRRRGAYGSICLCHGAKNGGDAELMSSIVTFQVIAAFFTLPLFVYIANQL